jgi:hypothetical protein
MFHFEFFGTGGADEEPPTGLDEDMIGNRKGENGCREFLNWFVNS